MSAPNHNFRSITHEKTIDLVELLDRDNPDTAHTKILTIHDKDAFIRWWDHTRLEKAKEAFEAGWHAGRKS